MRGPGRPGVQRRRSAPPPIRALAPVFAATAWAVATGPAPASAVQTLPTGDVEVLGHAEYDWDLRTLQGEKFSLEAFRGRVLVINAWATWCAPCVAELASLAALRDSVAEPGVRFLFVTAEDPPPVRAFVRRYGVDLPVVLEDRRMPEAFGLQALPTTWVVDGEGRIVLKHRGAADWDQGAVRAFLEALAREATAGDSVPEVTAELRRVPGGGDARSLELVLRVATGWKIYAATPEEVGLPLEVRWWIDGRPAGVRATWPAPRAEETGVGLARVHEGRVTASVRLSPGSPSAAEVRAVLAWAACRETLCVPGRTEVRLPGRSEVRPPGR